jgi:hypothetical protein
VARPRSYATEICASPGQAAKINREMFQRHLDRADPSQYRKYVAYEFRTVKTQDAYMVPIQRMAHLQLPVKKILFLKIGAPVFSVAAYPHSEYKVGQPGIVADWTTDGFPKVLFRGQREPVDVRYYTWRFHSEEDDEGKKRHGTVNIEQIPLVLGFAVHLDALNLLRVPKCTIHWGEVMSLESQRQEWKNFQTQNAPVRFKDAGRAYALLSRLASLDYVRFMDLPRASLLSVSSDSRHFLQTKARDKTR